MLRFRTFVLFCIFIGAVSANAVLGMAESGGLEVFREVDREVMNTSDRLRVTIRVEAPADHRVFYEEDEADFGEFDVLHRIEEEERLTAGGSRRVRATTWVLEPFLAGDYTVPAMVVHAVPEEGGEGVSFELDAKPIEVKSLLPAETQDLDIRPLVSPSGSLAWLSVLCLIVMISAIALWLGHRFFWKSNQEVVSEPLPQEAALRELKEIEAEEDFQSLGNRLQAIYRRYLEALGRNEGLKSGEVAELRSQFEDGLDHLRFSDEAEYRTEAEELIEMLRRFVSMAQPDTGEEAVN